jgi:hypothetical protein
MLDETEPFTESGGTDFRWKTRVVDADSATGALTIALDIACRAPSAADYKACDPRTLGVVMRLIAAAARHGLNAELRLADVGSDASAPEWTCAVLMRLTRRDGRGAQHADGPMHVYAGWVASRQNPETGRRNAQVALRTPPNSAALHSSSTEIT